MRAAEEEEARLRAAEEEELKKKAAEEEEARRIAAEEEEGRMKAAEEAARLAEQEEVRRRAAEEEKETQLEVVQEQEQRIIQNLSEEPEALEEQEEEDEDDEEDEDYTEASQIVDRVSVQIAEILAAAQKAAKKEKPALLAKKRELESSIEYVDALRYLEDPEGQRQIRQNMESEALQIVDQVAAQIADILAQTKTASKKEKPPLLARKRHLEEDPGYVSALRYLEDPTGERLRRRAGEDADGD